MVKKFVGLLETKSNNGEPYSVYKKTQSRGSLCHDRQQQPVENNLLNEAVKTVMTDQNGFVAVSKKEMDSRTHVKSIMHREGITEKGRTKIKQEPRETKEFPNISTQKHSNNSEPNSGKTDPACKGIFHPQFGLQCKRNIVDAEGTSEKGNILNTETILYKLNSKSINEVKIEQVLELKEDEALIQSPQDNDLNLNNNTAIDLSLRKNKKEGRKDTATEEIKNSSYSNASWQNKNVKDPVALRVVIKTDLEEAKGRNQYSKEIKPKYERKAVNLVQNPMALQRSSNFVKESRKKDPLKGNSIALNELIIKFENSHTEDNKQEHSRQTNLYDNSYNQDLNTSLEANIDTLSNANRNEKDLNDESSIQSCGANPDNSHFSLNKTSSADCKHESSYLKRNSLIEKKMKTKSKGIPSKILRKPYKTRQKTSQRNTNLKEPIRKTSKRGRKPKIKQPPHCIAIKTPFKEENNKRIAAKEEFLKLFQLENIPPELHSIATELPKPIILKQEFQTDIRNTELYKQPAFQPFVRLKRLSCEDLLIPLKTKKVRKSHTEATSVAGRRLNNCSQTTNDDNKDLIIHRAFSLNPLIKLKQLNGSRDHSYVQPSRDSSMTTPLSMTNDNNKDYWNYPESKYVNSQELFSPFHQAIPKHGSVISGNTDSGVSTSTPITLYRYDNNIRLLLQIAAERAFINNHLKEFGYSPIQFQLYNDFNELNIFLKYLIDKIDIN